MKVSSSKIVIENVGPSTVVVFCDIKVHNSKKWDVDRIETIPVKVQDTSVNFEPDFDDELAAHS